MFHLLHVLIRSAKYSITLNAGGHGHVTNRAKNHSTRPKTRLLFHPTSSMFNIVLCVQIIFHVFGVKKSHISQCRRPLRLERELTRLGLLCPLLLLGRQARPKDRDNQAAQQFQLLRHFSWSRRHRMQPLNLSTETRKLFQTIRTSALLFGIPPMQEIWRILPGQLELRLLVRQYSTSHDDLRLTRQILHPSVMLQVPARHETEITSALIFRAAAAVFSCARIGR